jgi:ferritin
LLKIQHVEKDITFSNLSKDIMLKQNILEALNAQINLEANSSATYLSMASWCDREGLRGCAAFFYAQSDEERMHMLKIVHYINDMDGHAIIPAVDKPDSVFESIQSVFKMVYDQERAVTESINKLMTLSQEGHDHATTVFLQWYVGEQREEEGLVREILDKIRLIGSGSQSLYYIDKELERINKARAAAAGAADAGGEAKA